MKMYSAFILFIIGTVVSDGFHMVLLHNNDMHSRFEETQRNSGTCKANHRNKKCIGGFARTAHVIREHRKLAEEGQGPEVLYLNAGDTFVGTIWYSLFTWNISAKFVNILHPDAMSLGNHEFDGGVAALTPFVDLIDNPIIVANIDLSNEPSLKKVKKSVVIRKAGRNIGIIGYVTPDTKHISAPGKTKFMDEVEAIKRESERLDRRGVEIIFVVGHSGFLMDRKIAAEVPLVDVVVGGHTNTFLWNGPQPDSEHVEGPYPTVVTQASGKKVPVVQAYAYTKYLGRLNISFDHDGEPNHFSGQPILLDSSVPQDLDVLELLEQYRPEVNEINTHVAGHTKVKLDGDSSRCRHAECNFGNLITDALVVHKAVECSQVWTDAPISLYNGGGIRNSIEPVDNDVTRGEVLQAIPFGNQIVTVTLNGSNLIKTLEIAARGNGETSAGEFLQMSGLRVVYDMSKPSMSRVVSVQARCGNCDIPHYEDVDRSKHYNIVTTSFLAIEGGDGHYVLRDNSVSKVTENLDDVDTVVWYLNSSNFVLPEIQGRISLIQKDSAATERSISSRTSLCSFMLYALLISVLCSY